MNYEKAIPVVNPTQDQLPAKKRIAPLRQEKLS